MSERLKLRRKRIGGGGTSSGGSSYQPTNRVNKFLSQGPAKLAGLHHRKGKIEVTT